MPKYDYELIVNSSEEFLRGLEKGGATKADEQIAILCTMITALTKRENLNHYSVVKLLIEEMQKND